MLVTYKWRNMYKMYAAIQCNKFKFCKQTLIETTFNYIVHDV